MSKYWNKIALEQSRRSISKKQDKISFKFNTKIGRFYLYLEKEDKSNISGKLLFFPDLP